METEYAIGIDFCSTSCRIGVFKDNSVQLLTDDKGNDSFPSYIAFTDNGILVGEAAKNQLTDNPANTIYDIVKLFCNDYEEIDGLDNYYTFNLSKGDKGRAVVTVNYKGKELKLSVEQIGAYLFGYLKDIASASLGFEVKRCSVSIASSSLNNRRVSIKQAAQIAGLEVTSLVDKQMAVAINRIRSAEDYYTSLFINFSYGFADVSVIEYDFEIAEQLSSASKIRIGNTKIDFIVYAIKEFKRKTGIDLAKDKAALAKLTPEIERILKELETAEESTLSVKDLKDGNDLDFTFTSSIINLILSTTKCYLLSACSEAIKASHNLKRDISEVIVSGSALKILSMRKAIEEYFEGIAVNFVYVDEKEIALGTTIIAIKNNNIFVEELEVFELFCLSNTLGIGKLDGSFQRLIMKNSRIPNVESINLTNAIDNQEYIEGEVLQGERLMAGYNTLIGRMKITNLPKAPAYQLNIEVAFRLDRPRLIHQTKWNLRCIRTTRLCWIGRVRWEIQPLKS